MLRQQYHEADTTLSLLKNGTIVGYSGSPNYLDSPGAYYRFEDGALKLKLAYGYDGKPARYDLAGRDKPVPVTNEEYGRIKAELTGGSAHAKLWWKPLWLGAGALFFFAF